MKIQKLNNIIEKRAFIIRPFCARFFIFIFFKCTLMDLCKNNGIFSIYIDQWHPEALWMSWHSNLRHKSIVLHYIWKSNHIPWEFFIHREDTSDLHLNPLFILLPSVIVLIIIIKLFWCKLRSRFMTSSHCWWCCRTYKLFIHVNSWLAIADACIPTAPRCAFVPYILSRWFLTITRFLTMDSSAASLFPLTPGCLALCFISKTIFFSCLS